MARAVRWVVVAGVLAAGVLGGCDSSSDEPVGSPTPTPTVSSSSASPSPSPSPTPSVSASGPDIPAAARAKTDAGAEAFFRFYIEQSALAWTTPDDTLLTGLATTSCTSCARLESVAKQLKADGQRYSSAPIRVRSVKTIRRSADEVAFEAALTELAVDVIDESGAKIESYPRRNITRAVSVAWGDGSWRLNGIGE